MGIVWIDGRVTGGEPGAASSCQETRGGEDPAPGSNSMFSPALSFANSTFASGTVERLGDAAAKTVPACGAFCSLKTASEEITFDMRREVIEEK